MIIDNYTMIALVIKVVVVKKFSIFFFIFLTIDMTPSMTEMAHPDTTTTKSMIFHGFLKQSLREEIFDKIMIVVNMWVEMGMSDWDNWTLCEHIFIDFTCTSPFVHIH